MQGRETINNRSLTLPTPSTPDLGDFLTNPALAYTIMTDFPQPHSSHFGELKYWAKC